MCLCECVPLSRSVSTTNGKCSAEFSNIFQKLFCPIDCRHGFHCSYLSIAHENVVTLGAQVHGLTKGGVPARPILVAFFSTASNDLDGTVACQQLYLSVNLIGKSYFPF